METQPQRQNRLRQKWTPERIKALQNRFKSLLPDSGGDKIVEQLGKDIQAKK